MSQTITFNDLANDQEFLQGLSGGEFCLVLGAGFSYGLKNATTPDDLQGFPGISYEDHRVIPLSKDFIYLTNALFSREVKGFRAAANLWENHEYQCRGKDLRDFFIRLFTLDQEVFRENNLESYQSILRANWHHIYTFNFDNVVESMVELRKLQSFYYTLFYPERTALRKSSQTAVVHLHGYLPDSGPDKLTFSDGAYGKLRTAGHSLYDPFHFDVKDGKKMVIIGTQFNEDIIDQNFLAGLEEKNLCIYHFDLENADFSTKNEIQRNPKYKFIRISGTHEVLDFFREHRTAIENVEIPGAVVISERYEEEIIKIGQERQFTTADFYLAKNIVKCQWYGVIRGWDVPRSAYGKICEAIKASFEDEYRSARISALIHGRGGSGKSTLMRRIALDHKAADFTVLWVSSDHDPGLFFTEGVSKIRNEYPHRKFLIFLEDWYRLKKMSSVLTQESLKSVFQLTNARMVLGDRDPHDSISKEFIYNQEANKFELKARENRDTIGKILDIIPEWKPYADKLLRENNDYESSLYYILWTIGRTVEKQSSGIPLQATRTEDLKGHFEMLIESDLRLIHSSYPGLAALLHYYACTYSAGRIFFSYDFFFDRLAGHFGVRPGYSPREALADSRVRPVLDIYVHQATGMLKSAGSTPLLAFNHDVLADEGLSRARIDGIDPFDDRVILKTLDIFMDHADNFSASGFLYYAMHNAGTKNSQTNAGEVTFNAFSTGNTTGFTWRTSSKMRHFSRQEKESALPMRF
jgi:hypothetical protein